MLGLKWNHQEVGRVGLEAEGSASFISSNACLWNMAVCVKAVIIWDGRKRVDI
jgi:hypothetical protein